MTDVVPSGREYLEGLRSGLPIFLGYFPAAMAFGILATSFHLSLWDALLFSLTNFAGASQFMSVSLIGASTAATEIWLAVFLINLRYFLMGASLVRRLPPVGLPARFLLAFGNTDENFSVASLRHRPLTPAFFFGLETASYTGWVSGTAAGVLAGAVLPSGLQAAFGGTLYALFAALLAPEFRRGPVIVFTAVLAGLINLIGLKFFHLPTGWSLVLAITLGTLGGTLLKERSWKAN